MPLWLPTKNETDKTQKFLTRADPGKGIRISLISNVYSLTNYAGDHANYNTSSGSPDFDRINGKAIPGTENESCKFITKNPFKAIDQFPKTSPINTGFTGVLQMMQTYDTGNKTESLTANCYGTMKAEETRVLTVRNQLRSLSTSDRSSDGIVIHACIYAYGSPAILTYLFVFRARSAASTGSTTNWTVSVSCYELREEMEITDGIAFDWSKLRQPGVSSNSLINNEKLFMVDAQQSATAEETLGRLRIFVSPILAGSTDSAPSIVATGISPSVKLGKLSVYKAQLAEGFKSFKILPNDTLDLGTQIETVRPLKRSDGSAALVVARSSWDKLNSTPPPGTPTKISYDIVQFSSDGAATVKQTVNDDAASLQFGAAGTINGTWLVGHTRESTKAGDIFCVEHRSWPDFRFRQGRESGNGVQFDEHKCSAQAAYKGFKIVQNYLDALISSPTGGCDVVNVAMIQDPGSKQNKISIRLHKQQSGAFPAKWDCWDSVYPDDLATKARIEAGYFFPIKWILVEDFGSSIKGYPGLLQVFSYYGCLGFRMFGLRGEGAKGNPKDKNTNYYTLVGQQCFNGQASTEMGSTILGSFGSGIMTWGGKAKYDFADASECSPPIAGTSMTGEVWDGNVSKTNLGMTASEIKTLSTKSWRMGTNKWWL